MLGFNNPLAIPNTAARHAFDVTTTFGLASERYNARDYYRNEYSAGQRVAAGIGVGIGTAIPLLATKKWAQSGFAVPLASSKTALIAGRATGSLALGAMAAAGIWKGSQIVKDDGHFGALGATLGVAAGFPLGRLAAGASGWGAFAPFAGVAAAAGLGLAGYRFAETFSFGTGHIGEQNDRELGSRAQDQPVDHNLAQRLGQFSRGGVAHFVEVGPMLQGYNLSRSWGLNDKVANDYTNSERAGALHGDLAATAIVSGGAIATLGALIGVPGLRAAGTSGVRSAANQALRVLPLSKMAQRSPAGAAGAAAGITALTMMREMERAGGGELNAKSLGAGALIAAGTGLGALIAARSPHAFAAGASVANRSIAGALAAASIIGVVTAARTPVMQFYRDAKAAHRAEPRFDAKKTALVGGIGASVGGVGAARLTQVLAPAGVRIPLPRGGGINVPGPVLQAGGAALGALAGGGAGAGLSATMPGLKEMAISSGAGAVLGAGIGFAAKGLKPGPAALGGALLGLSASALLRRNS